MFAAVPSNPQFPQLEEEVLAFWRERRIYEQSLEQRRNAPRFVFYEGPPTANGMPHPGHCLTRAIKDLFPRYRTMRGYFCERKAGWDTHGLPVEVEVCKELGIHAKDEIEAYGVEPFIHKCQQSVWRYMKQWERLTERLGFWIHLDEAYVTYHQSYVESVWWSLKNLFDRGLLYQGHKIVWWWAQGGTALSSGEVGQAYRQVADPSVYVRFPLVDEPDLSLLVWTTTPWTLPSNQFAAVHPELKYAIVRDEQGQRLILAEALVESIAAKTKRTLEIEGTLSGSELIGRRYVPPFDYYYRSLGEKSGQLKNGDVQHVAWRIAPATFVTVDSGTGVVHEAPAFGEVDFDLLLEEQQRFVDGDGPELICAVGPDGKFTAEARPYEGRWVKDADKDIARELKSRGLLYHQEQYLHEYPFCWRAEEDPLIQYPRRSWFVRTTQFKNRMIENNQRIQWLPEHIRDGRFGNFLESNVDWALSRERYWGTPLPIWVCQETGKMEAVGSYTELLSKKGVDGTQVWEEAKKKFPNIAEDLRIHKPYIDEITYDSPFAKGARMRRVPDVIDCWYDSGAMPFAQWGYPHQGRESFHEQFPADFISEAIDQTRGWFYSQLAISTLLFGDETADSPATPYHDWPHPFRTCIVLGLMLGEDGQKMSKSRRNYREPQEIFDRYGADALRWFFFANQPPWTTIRYKEQAIKDSIPEFLLRLWNVYSFFVIYAKLDGFDPSERIQGPVEELTADRLSRGKGYRKHSERGELDRWILSELEQTVQAVVERMDAYDNFTACRRIADFVDGLSNWYVRRSRQRFWSEDKTSADKIDAYWTLYECLVTMCKVIAPFTPFLAETMWGNLAGVFGTRATESVHLCAYPTSERASDELLSERMNLLRTLASLGRNARMESKLKVRQPLAKVEVVLADATHLAWLKEHDELLREELNVKRIEYTQEAHYIEYVVQPNFKRLGPRLGKLLPAVKAKLQAANGKELRGQLQNNGRVELVIEGQTVVLDHEDLQISIRAQEGWAAADDQTLGCAVVLNTELTPELVREGYARDVVRLVNEGRKDLDCEYNDRIRLGLVTDSAELRKAIEENLDYILQETLAVEVVFEALRGAKTIQASVGDFQITIYIDIVRK